MANLLKVSEFRLQKWEDKFFTPKIEDDAKIRNFFAINSIVNLSEEVLERCVNAETGSNVIVDIETVIHQKDLLIEEKDKRLKEKDQYIGAQDERIEELQKQLEMKEILINQYKNGKILPEQPLLDE